MPSVVVLTAGRTGSHLIVENLRRAFKDVHHTHNPFFRPVDNNSVCLVSKRKNDFLAIISMQVGAKTNEYTNYKSKEIVPFIIEPKDFTNVYLHYNAVYNQIKFEYYEKIIEIYYEDLIENPKHLFSLFGLDMLTDYSLSLKSPYDYEEIVVNFKELLGLYNDYEKDKENFLKQHPVQFNTDILE